MSVFLHLKECTDENYVVIWSGCCQRKYANPYKYRSGTVNSNTVNSKFHLIQIFGEIVFATLLIFNV